MLFPIANLSEAHTAYPDCIGERRECAARDRMQDLLGEHPVRRLETDSVRALGKRDYRTEPRFELPRRTWEATEHSSTHRRTLRASSRYRTRLARPPFSNAEESRQIQYADRNCVDRCFEGYICSLWA